MVYYLYMIRILQLILHLPIFIIQAPANASWFCSLILPVASFDFQIEWLLGKIFKFADDGAENFPYNFALIDYGNNSINQMGSIFVVNMLQNVMIVVYVLMHVFGLTNEFRDLHASLKLKLLQILVQVIEVYLEYLLSGSLNMMYPLTAPSGELFGLIYASECLVFTLLLLPVYLLYIFNQSREKFLNEEFCKREGIVYQDQVKTDTNWEMAYFMIYLLRRMIYVSTAYWIPVQSLQLIVILYLNIYVTIYLGQIRPKISRFFNRLELFNEFLYQWVCFHQFFYTDFIPDLELKFSIGWSQMGIVTFLIFTNLSIIFYYGFKSF
jgi:hypothetical protein